MATASAIEAGDTAANAAAEDGKEKASWPGGEGTAPSGAVLREREAADLEKEGESAAGG